MKAKPKEANKDQSGNFGTAVFVAKPNRSKRQLVIVAVGLVVIAVVGGAIFWHWHTLNNNRAVYAAEERTLQTSLSTALGQGDNQGVVNTTSQLIMGNQERHFTINNKTVSQYYMDRGVAYLNLKQYSNAVSDFQKARGIDSSVTQAALQGEVQARYALGQRKQLVPLFQQLANLAKNSLDQRSGTPETYQQYIDAIQHNQEIQL